MIDQRAASMCAAEVVAVGLSVFGIGLVFALTAAVGPT